MIETENVYKSYDADGEQRVWDFPYAVDNPSDVKVYVSHDDVLTEIDSSKYVYNSTTQKVTYPADEEEPAVQSGDIVLIWRQTPITQEESSAVNNFKSDDIERIADKLTIICQELSDKLGRAIVWDPTQQYETDAKTYLNDLTALKDTATTQAGIATNKAGEAAASATSADASATKSQKWAEGTDQEVAALGGTRSSKGWAAVSQAAAESEAVQTVVTNIEDIQTVAGIQSDVTQVASIKNAVSTVSSHDTEILNVNDNLASIINVSNIKDDVTTVAGIKDDVTAVSGIKTAVTNVNSNSSNINAVASNESNINAVAGNATNINAVNSNKTNIDKVAAIDSDVSTVADNVTNIRTVAAADSNITAVADDLTNIDLVAGSLSDIQDKQNKTLTTSLNIGGATQTTVEGALGALNEAKVDAEDWHKPSDWIDIRSGATTDSIYFLVAHSADYTKYPVFGCKFEVTGGTYDVYVDGIKKLTVANNTEFALNWQTLALTSGYDTTVPEALRTHIVRCTPTRNDKKFTHLNKSSTNSYKDGLLWAHFGIDYPISLVNAFGGTAGTQLNLQAVTAKDDVLKVTSISSAFGGCRALANVPVFDFGDSSYIGAPLSYAFYQTNYQAPLKKVHIKNLQLPANTASAQFMSTTAIEEVIFENCSIPWYASMFLTNNRKLKKFPSGLFHVADVTDFQANKDYRSLQDTFLDLTKRTGLKRLLLNGDSNSVKTLGLKGVTVSPEAPFSNASSPQLDVSYTGLDRAALVNLFKSMPYNVGYEEVGSPTIASGVISGFSASDYATINLSNVFSANIPIRKLAFQAKFTTGNDVTFPNTCSILSYNTSGIYEGVKIYNSRVEWGIGYVSGGGMSIRAGSDLSANTTYWVKGYFVGNVANFDISTDGTTYTSVGTKDIGEAQYVINHNKAIGLGNYVDNTARYFEDGSIDASATAIQFDGVPYFMGQAKMTKTCDIRGCTGTADLTQADKDIAEDKGWALTVA